MEKVHLEASFLGRPVVVVVDCNSTHNSFGSRYRRMGQAARQLARETSSGVLGIEKSETSFRKLFFWPERV